MIVVGWRHPHFYTFMGFNRMASKYKVNKKNAIASVRSAVEYATDFIESELLPNWERAEKYFAGEVDAPDVSGRSTAVKTEVRDSIRSLKPSVMRVLLSSSKIVSYEPVSVASAGFVDQQALYVTQLFWKNDGYRVIYNASDEAMKKKIGPIKTWWEEAVTNDAYTMTGLSEQTANEMLTDENFDVTSVTQEGNTFTLKGVLVETNGRIRMEAFPASEYFVSPDSSDRESAYVHGHRRTVTVADAIDLGLEYKNWLDLGVDDGVDDEDNHRAGYNVQSGAEKGEDAEDILNHEFTLTECYVELDLLGTGRRQKYCFWLGGEHNVYIDHDEVDDWCIDVVEIDPVPFSMFGNSIPDIISKDQDTSTSLLRAVIDNAHAANNPRFAANPMLVDFRDLMSNTLNSPVKLKQNGVVQVIDIPFTGQQLLPLMQHLEQGTTNKVGVTKAAQGLDPNAMQSTDKNAVQNTIALAQGQVELMVRNIIETGLVPVFRRLLRLSMEHMDPMQLVSVQGQHIPLSTAQFDAALCARPRVGLGNANDEQRMGALQFALQKQEGILQQFGLDNPFTSLSQLYNTLEDIMELNNVSNVGRYFKVVTPEIEAELAKKMAEDKAAAEKAAAENQPADPAETLKEIEKIKAQAKLQEAQMKADGEQAQLDLDTAVAQNRAMLEEAKLRQKTAVDLAKLEEAGRAKRAEYQMKMGDALADDTPLDVAATPVTSTSMGSGADSPQ